jgi:hypothetical protein
VQSGDQGNEAIPAVPELRRLDCGIPAALLLIETTEQDVDLPMDFSVGMILQAETVGTLAVMEVRLRHGTTLRGLSSKPEPVYQESRILFVDGP